MSNSVRPYGPELTRFLCPWDSPGKNTGVGCHFLLQGVFPTQGSNLCLLHYGAPWTVVPRFLCPWNSPGKNIGVGSHSPLQGIFPIQGLNPSLLHCRQILYHFSHQGSPLQLCFKIIKACLSVSHSSHNIKIISGGKI